MKRLARIIRRLAGLAGVLLSGTGDYLLFARRRGLEARLAWMQRMCRRFLRLLNGRLAVHGPVPTRGLVVCNHLGYVDVLVIGAVCPAVFVAKQEVRSWPIFGGLARLAGTVFVNRSGRRQIHDQLQALAQILATGAPLALFPEGTSSDGSRVLPFRSSLLEAALATGSVVTPAALTYATPRSGDPARDICYWGDMVFVTHLFRLLALEGFSARLHFGESERPGPNRKGEAVRLQEWIRAALGEPVPDNRVARFMQLVNS
jgi:1-acyl-sn-glycerol-3-phosphate acyltransferase